MFLGKRYDSNHMLFYRIRFGYLHVVNNDYASGWGMYAIGGSEAPTILSEGNRFLANGPREVRRLLFTNMVLFNFF